MYKEQQVRVIAAFEGNGYRPSHRGVGINDGEKMYTLNSVEVHGVCVARNRFRHTDSIVTTNCVGKK